MSAFKPFVAFALAASFALTGCTSNPPAPEAPKFTAATLPEICKKMATDRDGCEKIKTMGLSSSMANGMYNVCFKRVNNGQYAACPVSYEEAKKILAGG